MRKVLYLWLKLWVFYIVVFQLARLYFVLIRWETTKLYSFYDILSTFIHGFKMDVASAAYCLFLSAVLFCFSFLIKLKVISKADLVLQATLFFAFTIFTVADAELYKYWGFRLDVTPLRFLNTPSAITDSADTLLILLLLLTMLVFSTLGIYLLYKIYKPLFYVNEKSLKRSFVLYFTVGLFTVIPARGGFGIAPMNSGQVYFHTSEFPNHAAVNGMWNFLYSVGQAQKHKIPNYVTPLECTNIVSEFHSQKTSSVQVLNTEKPNIIFLIVESFTAKLVNLQAEGKDVLPHFNKYIHEGIYFSDFYASGDRSDKGLVSILSGYPAQPESSIMKSSEKTSHLPHISKTLMSEGYSSMYSYGGDIDFANMRSFLIHEGFQKVICDKDFPESLNTSKWGVHDEFMMDRVFNELQNSKKPYFSVTFTLSNHEPFHVPGKLRFNENTSEYQIFNTANYTDSVLNVFITRLKASKEWNNTLVVILADHGVRNIHNSANSNPEKYRIPMLWLGGAINPEAVGIIEQYGSQTDLACTLLSQLHLNTSDFYYSRNLFGANTENAAFYIFNNGIGYVSDTLKFSFDATVNRVSNYQGKADEETVRKAKAVMQYIIFDTADPNANNFNQ